ncbi:MAG: hypothetical protein P1U34_00320 [Coxiellaceae bacterium]|nr:hypothetical protein [Coxiellaceae bacterium]
MASSRVIDKRKFFQPVLRIIKIANYSVMLSDPGEIYLLLQSIISILTKDQQQSNLKHLRDK